MITQHENLICTNQKGMNFMELVFQFPETKIENKKLLLWGRPSSFRIYQKLFYPFSSLRDLWKIRFEIFWSQNQKGTIFNCTNQRFPETKIENKKLLLWRRPSSFRIYQKLYYPFSSLRDLWKIKSGFFLRKKNRSIWNCLDPFKLLPDHFITSLFPNC